MGINVYVETAWDKYLDENDGNVGDEPPYNSIVVNAVAWLSITAIMVIGLVWYFVQNRRQSKRLIELEVTEKSRLEELRNGKTPLKSNRRGSIPSEHEIV